MLFEKSLNPIILMNSKRTKEEEDIGKNAKPKDEIEKTTERKSKLIRFICLNIAGEILGASIV